jgi:hypothetical protein
MEEWGKNKGGNAITSSRSSMTAFYATSSGKVGNPPPLPLPGSLSSVARIDFLFFLFFGVKIYK